MANLWQVDCDAGRFLQGMRAAGALRERSRQKPRFLATAYEVMSAEIAAGDFGQIEKGAGPVSGRHRRLRSLAVGVGWIDQDGGAGVGGGVERPSGDLTSIVDVHGELEGFRVVGLLQVVEILQALLRVPD
jgi:hypothetical protein